jgi:CheY-like chemotaxis protein
MHQTIAALGYSVKTASSGAEAIALDQVDPNDIDLVVLDMIMLGLGGLETYARLKEINPNIKVIFSSGYSSDGQTELILNSHKQHFIQKPFTLEEMSNVLRKAM